MKAQLELLGVRGSVPTTRTKSDQPTELYGGDTTSFAIRQDGCSVIVDAGTGIRYFKPKEGERILLLFTHTHDDHTAGLGFFGAVYNPDSDITLMASEEHLRSLRQHYNAENSMFPVALDKMAGIRMVGSLDGKFEFGEFKIEPFRLNHPQNAYGFLIDVDDGRRKRVGIAADHEPDEEIFDIGEKDRRLIECIRGCDVLLMDAQYTPEEYDPGQVGKKGFKKVGWGHGVDIKVARMGLEASDGLVLLTHHDPEHGDGFLNRRLGEIRETYAVGKVDYARQGRVIEL